MISDNQELMNKAIDSSNLSARASINSQYGTSDFSGWTRDIMEKLKFTNVLDVCCGTGNQLVLYAKNPDVKNITGVDLSKESLNSAYNRISTFPEDKNLLLKNVSIDEMFLDTEINQKYDLISCFYGLYYSKDVNKLLNDMIEHLSDTGAIVIVGPYGENNKNFFNLLEKYFKLPELVVRSSTTFMENEVLPVLSEKLKIEELNFVNSIHYSSFDDIFNYWKSSTFYFSDQEENIKQELESHFSKNDKFIIEKHVKAYIARK